MHYLDIPPVLGSQFFDSGLQLRPEFTSCGYWASRLTSLFPRLWWEDDRWSRVTGTCVDSIQ